MIFFTEAFNKLNPELYMIKVINIILTLILFQFSYAQYTLEGYVLDKENIAIPYTSIYHSASDQGTYSAINGYFTLEVEKLPVSLMFSNVGYNTKQVEIAAKQHLKIILEEKITVLNEIVVQVDPLAYKYIGSPKKERGASILFGALEPFDQYGIIVKNVNNILYANPGLISFSIKVAPWSSFGIRDGVKPNGKKQLRLRMYNFDESKIVGDDILHENIFLSPSEKGWYKVNIEHVSINLPKQGFVLAIEWIENNPTYQHSKMKGEQYTHTFYGIHIKGHKMSVQEKRLYETARLWNVQQNGWEKEKTFDDYIPCFRLEYFELDD